MPFESISIESVDFNNLKPEDVFEWIMKFGSKRYVAKQYIIPSKGEDPRLIYPDDSPKGLYPTVIVPDYNLGKTLFIIPVDQLDKIRAIFESQISKKECV